jgi:hypothetical protein
MPPKIPEDLKEILGYSSPKKEERRKSSLPMWSEEKDYQNSESMSVDDWLQIDSSDNILVNVEKAKIGFSPTFTISRKRISEADLEAEILTHFRLNDPDSLLFEVGNRYAEKFCHWGVCGGGAIVSAVLKMHQKNKFMRKMIKKPIVEALS